MIPYTQHFLDDDDRAAVVAVLRSPRIAQGPAIEEFEAAICRTTGARYAVAVSSGTAALHAAVRAAELGPTDRVVMSPLSFVASASCVCYDGATPMFVDIDPDTLNLDPTKVVEADAVIAVHYAGLPVDLVQLACRPKVVIEDAAHALGAHTPDGPVGNCARSDMTAFSFHPAKAVTSGEGGAITTNSAELAERLRRFRSHDIVPTPERGGWSYDAVRVGYNYRLSDIHAALGTSQLAKLAAVVAQRNELARRYRRLLEGLAVTPPPLPASGSGHAYHLFPVRVPHRRAIYERMRAAGIGVQVHYVPLYRHTAFASLGYAPQQFPVTEKAYEELLSLPLFPTLSDADQERIVDCLASALAHVGDGQPAAPPPE